MKIPRVLSRFLIGYLLLHLLAATIFVSISSRTTRYQMVENTKDKMESLALVLQAHVQELPGGLQDDSLLPHVLKLGKQTDFRYTVIDSDGNVLADSEKGDQNIGLHSDRSEVIQSRTEKIGFSNRFSDTLQKPMMYLAIAYQAAESEPSSGFIRVAVPSVTINESIHGLQRNLWTYAVLLGALTTGLLVLLAFSAIRPLKGFAEAARNIGHGNFQQALPTNLRNEWGELADAYAQMQQEISNREGQFRETNARFDAMLSTMIEGVLATDGQGRISISNRAAERMLSLSSRDVVNRDLLDIARYPELHTAIQSARENKATAKAEFETLDPDRRRIKARATYLSSEPEKGVAIVLRDVTDLHALENMRRDFVANVSHELKTPLASIKAYAETLRLGAIDDKDKNVQFVTQIETQAELLNLQIQDLLEIARVESGSSAFNIENIDINQLCRRSAQDLQAQADQRKVELLLDIDQHPIIAKAEANGVTTIINNLISNAIHYTPAEGQVTVRTRLNGDRVQIEVTDTGIGISPEQQTRVFERFYRVDKARSRDEGGTGLGLAIVKHLTQAFDGQVELESQIGKGSTFRVLLPGFPRPSTNGMD